jgi:membrane protein implicated in regulation of membrane protease activity
MSERRQEVLYLLAFVGFILIIASPFAVSIDNLLVYVALPLFLILTVLSLYSWKRARDLGGRQESGTTWPKRIETLLRKLPPF